MCSNLQKTRITRGNRDGKLDLRKQYNNHPWVLLLMTL